MLPMSVLVLPMCLSVRVRAQHSTVSLFTKELGILRHGVKDVSFGNAGYRRE